MNLRVSLQTICSTCAVTALVTTGFVTVATPSVASAQTHATTSAVSVADLADSSASQQRWISEPDSRIALNPSHSQTNDAVAKADNGLDTVFYANQEKLQASNVLRNSFTDTPAPQSVASVYDEGDTSPALSDSFTTSTVPLWASTNNGGTLEYSANGGVVTRASDKDWGGVGRQITMNTADTPILVVSVASTTGTWAVKIHDGHGDIKVQEDTAATGTFAYDLTGTISTGEKTITVKLFTSGNGDTTFRAVSIHARPAFEDNFTDDTLKNWNTNVQSNNGATISPASSGLGATITSNSTANFGAVARTVTVDLSKNPILSIAVSSLSKGSMWAMKLTGADGSGDFAQLQKDTDATGVFSYDVAAITGKTGTQTFGIKLFSTKSPTPTSATFTRLSFHSNVKWTQTPNTYTNTWNPQSLDWSGSYANGEHYSTQDVFVDDDTVSRLIDSSALTTGNPTLTGDFTGNARWDASRRVLTIITDGKYTRAVAFPTGTTVSFFDNVGAAATGGAGSASPTSSSQTWLAVLPRNAATAIGLGYAYGVTDAAQSNAAASAIKGTQVATVTAALAARVQEWNTFLARVPSIRDYNLHVVDSQKVTSRDIRAMYYRAFVDLRQTVMPPQPESGIAHYQVATGKAATYNGGSSRNKASASWDSLLGIQYLAYTDPDLAWDSFIGMMADVESDGNLNGESLPSRKAQTAWILYSVTGDKEKLAHVYPAIKAHMDWSSKHLAWNISSHYPGSGVSASDERDVEFVDSLVIDLDYAADIARTLGNDADATGYLHLQNDLSQDFSKWFFKDGKAVQYYWTSVPDATYEQRAGTAQYVATGLHMPGLSSTEISAIMARFDEEYDSTAQFAGLASDAIKAPDAQFVAYGLLEQGQSKKAQVFLESVLRDVTSTHAFSEVYQAGTPAISRGESPTTFGMAQVIDNLWILNGYRSDEGTPTFVRLSEQAGGVSGLSYLGKSLNVNTSSSDITISGNATQSAGTCTQYGQKKGVSSPIAFNCGSIALSASSVQAGGSLHVTGSRYTPDSTARLLLDGKSISTTKVDDNGKVSFIITIPAHTTAGKHVLTIENEAITATADLKVIAVPIPSESGTNSAADTTKASGVTDAIPSSTSQSGVSVHTGGIVSSPVMWILGITLLILGVAGSVGMAAYRSRNR